MSTLRCTCAVRPVACAAATTSARPQSAFTDTSTSAASAAAKSVPGPCSQASTGRGDPGRPQRERLVQDGDPEGVRTAGEHRAGGRDQPVAVAVGLDHRHQRAADALPQHRGVGGDRVEVDDDLGAGGCGRHAPESPRRPRRDPAHPADRVREPPDQVPGHEGPALGGELAGPPVQVGGDRGGRGRVEAGRQQRAE